MQKGKNTQFTITNNHVGAVLALESVIAEESLLEDLYVFTDDIDEKTGEITAVIVLL